MSAVPPATLEGWYALHQMFALDWAALRRMDEKDRESLAREAEELLDSLTRPNGAGWSAVFQMIGGGADFMLLHFRETPEELGEVELRLRKSGLGAFLRLEYDYLSVTEAGLYHATAEAARDHGPGSEEFRKAIEEAAEAERASRHTRLRLYPEVPEEMRYVSFYPMTKRRVHPDNWYTLPVEERNRLMREHGLTGRNYAGRIYQVITGSVGMDDWEWGVTLFARDVLDFKRIVTEMRYDEASSRYGEFGSFFTGIRLTPAEWAERFIRTTH